ncbi:hypothetical protein LINGRAHAP2_LOCUS17593 [Linum grandiflorum]
MEYSANTVTLTLLLLSLFILTSAVPADEKFPVVKEPSCSNEKGDDMFPPAVVILLGKLVANTPKHAAKEGGGYSYTTKKMAFGQKGEGAASCDEVKGKDDHDHDQCRECLAFAMGKLTAKCADMASGEVELNGCKMSYKKD